MFRVFGFELYRARRDGLLAALFAGGLAAFAIYAFTRHLGALGGAVELPLNISYASYVLPTPLFLLMLAVAAYLANSFREDRVRGLAATILTQGVSRGQYFRGKLLYGAAVLAVLLALLAAVSWMAANNIFEGRFPITSDDTEIRPAALLPGYAVFLAAAFAAMLPALVGFGLAGYCGLSPLLPAAAGLLAREPLLRLFSALAAPGTLIDYGFAFDASRFGGWTTSLIAGGGLALAALGVLAARLALERVDF